MKSNWILFLFILFGSVSCSENDQLEYFELAKQRIKEYNPERKDLAILIDYRRNILRDRLYVLNMSTKEIVLSSKVSHAWNSGIFYPSSLSNTSGTEKTSKGNYITRGTYNGKFGYSMRIDGLDKGLNDNARSRAIVFHSDKKMKTIWSDGCFVTPEEINKKIIELTKNGVLVCVII